jgi:hypothetical protein
MMAYSTSSQNKKQNFLVLSPQAEAKGEGADPALEDAQKLKPPPGMQ